MHGGILGNKDGSRTGQKEDSKALVTIDGEGVDWTNHSEDEDYALMACNSSDSDTEREQLSDASIEIKAYSQGLKKVKAQLVAHQQGQLCDGMHDVYPHPCRKILYPFGPEIEGDSSQFTSIGSKTDPISESGISTSSGSDVLPIIEEYESDSRDEYCVYTNGKRARKNT
ncbi:hypothetical protein Tco_0855030 [Tanacetum coccineum]